MAKLQLRSPLHTLITFDGHPAAEFQGGHVFTEMTLVTQKNFYLASLTLGRDARGQRCVCACAFVYQCVGWWERIYVACGVCWCVCVCW